MTPNIIALDLATEFTGWVDAPADAVDAWPHGRMMDYGRFCASGSDLNERLSSLSSWLCRLLMGAHVVAVEEVYIRHANAATALAKAHGVLIAAAISARVKILPVTATAIKKTITGNGRASKEDVISAVLALGFSPVTSDEADAIALAHHVIVNRLWEAPPPAKTVRRRNKS